MFELPVTIGYPGFFKFLNTIYIQKGWKIIDKWYVKSVNGKKNVIRVSPTFM
jgi:hypothetical protein